MSIEYMYIKNKFSFERAKNAGHQSLLSSHHQQTEKAEYLVADPGKRFIYLFILIFY